MLTLPVIVRELEYFIESFPLYIHRLHTLATDANRPWLSKLVGQGLGEAERSIGDLTALASNWAGTFFVFYLVGRTCADLDIVPCGTTPIVASYLLYHWHSMIAAIDNWIPPARRETGARLPVILYRHDRRFCSRPGHTLSCARCVLWSDIMVDRT